jgi:archaellum component FlaC
MSAKGTLGFEEISAKLDRVIDGMVTHEDLNQLEERLEAKIDKRIGEVIESIDNLVKAVSDLTMEYSAVKMQLSRHEEWIKLLAKKSGVQLPY